MDLVPQLVDAVQHHLRTLGFEVRELASGFDPGADLTIMHPAARAPLSVLVTADLPAHPRLRLPPGPTVVAAPTVTPNQAAVLRAAGAVGFIDASGNASIQTDGIYIHIEGRSPTELSRAARLESSRGWAARPTGLRVLFALLTRPEFLGSRLTDIAQAADVSVATVHRVLADLAGQGLVDGESMSRYWLDRDGAVRAWLEGYTRVVAPKVKESAYVTPVQADEWIPRIASDGLPVWATSGAALAALGAHLRPVSATIYRPADLQGALTGVQMVRPRPGETPNLFIRRAWWPRNAYPPGLVPDLLIYADALTSGDPRIITTAEEVMSDVADIRAAVVGE